MLITMLMMLPLLAVLLWGYGYLLPKPRKLTVFDTVLLTTLTLISVILFTHLQGMDETGTGPIWPEIMMALGFYHFWGLGLALGVYVRRRVARGQINRQESET